MDLEVEKSCPGQKRLKNCRAIWPKQGRKAVRWHYDWMLFTYLERTLLITILDRRRLIEHYLQRISSNLKASLESNLKRRVGLTSSDASTRAIDRPVRGCGGPRPNLSEEPDRTLRNRSGDFGLSLSKIRAGFFPRSLDGPGRGLFVGADAGPGELFSPRQQNFQNPWGSPRPSFPAHPAPREGSAWAQSNFG